GRFSFLPRRAKPKLEVRAEWTGLLLLDKVLQAFRCQIILELSVLGSSGIDGDFGAHGRRERRQQPVVILRRNWIGLVGGAASAADGQAEHAGADGAEDVVQLVVAFLLDLVGGYLRAVDARGEEAGGCEGERIVGLQLVAGNLPLHEDVVRNILVENLD